MRETQYLEVAGQRHPIRLTLRAVQQLSARFGGIDNMGRILMDTSDMDAQLDALNDVLIILLKAGRCFASLAGEQLPPELPCDPIDVIDTDVASALSVVLSAMRGDSEREVETVPKNGEATPDSQVPRGSTTTDSGPA